MASDEPFTIPGPWEHRFVAANGARFHVAEAGSGPAVVLVHGFPGFWWSWRAQLPALAEAGYRAIAVDVRGFGGSDKPPQGYDVETAAADLAGLARSLGADRAVFVGQGLGAWTLRHLPGLHPGVTAAVALVSMPHPRSFRGRLGPLAYRRWDRYSRGLRAPFLGEERQAAAASAGVADLLRTGSGRSAGWITDEVVGRYAAQLAQPFVPHAVSESFERLRPSWRERRRLAAIAATGEAPVLVIRGQHDLFVSGDSALTLARTVGGRLRFETIPGAGHFVPEEAPGLFNAALIDWLAGLALPAR